MYRLYYLLLLLVVACSGHKDIKPIKLVGEAQGTYYSIIYFDLEKHNFQHEIDSLLDDFDMSVSLWKPNSIISRFNNNDPTVQLDKYFQDNVEISLDVARKTQGDFDFTVGPLVRAWGFGFDETKNVDSLIIDSLLDFVGYEKLNLIDGVLSKSDKRMKVDFNAVAQGYSVDLIASYFEGHGVSVYLIDVGGEVKGKGKKPDGTYWKVGIEKPAQNKNDARKLKAIIELKNRAVATSGNYRKFYEEDGIRYSHTINPKTGYPVKHSLLSVSVLASDAATADAYATAFMVMGLEKSKLLLNEITDMDAFFIFSNQDGHFETFATPGFGQSIISSYE